MKFSIKNIPYERKKSIAGFLFISVWLAGFIYFFIIPFVFAFIFSVSNVAIKTGFIDIKYEGFRNYTTFLTVDPTFYIRFVAAIQEMVWQLPLIVTYSLFMALILNSKFRGRMFARSIFFLPVVIVSGTIMGLMSNVSFDTAQSGGARLFEGVEFGSLLTSLGMPSEFVSYVMSIINNIFELVWKSGVQILFFLAGLQTIPKSLYEAAQVEGATKWEEFWKITFPIISPTTILCVFYTLVDMANDTSNPIVAYIGQFIRQSKFSMGSTLSVIWFLVIIALAAAVFLISRRNVYFMDDRG